MLSGGSFFNKSWYFNGFAGFFWSSDANGTYKA
jgi:hypothetical protein